jgi:hypothetical protein
MLALAVLATSLAAAGRGVFNGAPPRYGVDMERLSKAPVLSKKIAGGSFDCTRPEPALTLP